jgi:hypothetical protein
MITAHKGNKVCDYVEVYRYSRSGLSISSGSLLPLF